MFMNLQKISYSLVFAMLLFLGFSANAQAQKNDYQISAPVTHKNLSVFLIHGKNELHSENILTLQEAMEQKTWSCLKLPMSTN
jgi:hypothetical protein